ncbi:MAG: Hsp20/alpha crystallin family protein [Candidatus Pacebacteria bacterium]|nr:Hsp20/alpha crystallin family protein [Candidatus Paceibacterota bacterium]
MTNKKSFFEKLTGSIKFNSEEEEFDTMDGEYLEAEEEEFEEEEDAYEEEIGELSVDMYRVNNAIIIKTMVAGIQKSEIDITLTRDQITIEGSRKNDPEGRIDEHYYEELFWGSFERTINLPEEIDIELAEAHESHGLLTLVLPLVDRDRQARLKIK